MVKNGVGLSPLRINRRILVALFDVSIFSLALPLAHLLRSNFRISALSHEIVMATVLAAAVGASLYWVMRIHRSMWRYASSANLLLIARWVTVAVLALLPIMFAIDRLNGFARSIPFIHWGAAIVGVWGARIAYAWWYRPESKGLEKLDMVNERPVLLAGHNDSLALTIQLINQKVITGYHVVGILDRDGRVGRTIYGVGILGTPRDLKSVRHTLAVQGIDVDYLIISDLNEALDPQAAEWLKRDAADSGVTLEDLVGVLAAQKRRNPTIAVSQQPAGQFEAVAYERLNRGLDISVATIAAVFAMPLILATSLVVWLAVNRDVIFTQFRPGLSGRTVRVHKFCSMRDPIDSQGRQLTDEERTPWVGLFLRRTRIDELPQLWNIIRGEMSLIGPRPLLIRDLPSVDPQLIELRNSVRPGVTGWAQVNGGNHLTPREKLSLDLWYIRNRSFALDVKILFLTVRMVLFGERTNTQAVEMANSDRMVPTGERAG